jgi:hypothetical protein
MCPAGRIAARSLMDIPITLESAFLIFSSSPTVLTSSRRGDEPCAALVPPTKEDCGSETLVTRLPVSLSNHSLAIIPLDDGAAPLRNVECPTAVTVAAWTR